MTETVLACNPQGRRRIKSRLAGFLISVRAFSFSKSARFKQRQRIEFPKDALGALKSAPQLRERLLLYRGPCQASRLHVSSFYVPESYG